MRVAVTGADGMIGRSVVAALAGDDRVEEVVAIDSRPPAAQGARVRAVRRDTRDPRLQGDLAGVDALVHLAFRVLEVRGAFEVNVAGSRNAFQSAIAAGARTIVHASSAAVYGSGPDNPVPLRENQPIGAELPFAYPQAKAAVERILDDLAAANPEVRMVRMRPTTALGPGAVLLLARRVYVSLSDFDPPMQFTWVDDVAAAFVAALHNEAASGVYNVGAPGTVPSSEVARILGVRSLRLTHRARRTAAAIMHRLRVPGALHPGFVDMSRYPIVVAADRAERELGWRAERDSRATLHRYAATV